VRRALWLFPLVALRASAQLPEGVIAPPDAPAIVARARLDTAAVAFRALVLPETVYVGQQVTYQLGVFVQESVRDRLRRMEALPPEMRAMLAYDSPSSPNAIPLRTASNRHYDAHVYQRAIFPLAPGRWVIPPARLVYAMPLTYSFFSREESFEARSDSMVVVAIEPPSLGRPLDFQGAVGSFSVRLRVEQGAARVGDPLMLTARISGTGNIQLLPRPTLTLPWARAVPAGERISVTTDTGLVHGAKEFDWVITPQRSGRFALAGVRYPSWNPATRRYEDVSAPPETLIVAPGSLATLDTGVAAHPQRLALRTADRGGLPLPPYRQTPFWLLVLLAPIPALVLVAGRTGRGTRTAASRADELRAVVRQPSVVSARRLRRAFLEALAERLRLPAVTLAEPSVLARAVRRAGSPAIVATAAADLLAELNQRAFGRDEDVSVDPALVERAHRIFRNVDTESRSLGARPWVIVLALLVGSAGGLVAELPTEGTPFAKGVAAYQTSRYRAAAEYFAAAANATPRDADAWANLGTAAWESADTAGAALAWQRALRLDPLAIDMRERLEPVAPATSSGVGFVPPAPVAPLAWLCALLWIGGWAALASGLRRARVARSGAPGTGEARPAPVSTLQRHWSPVLALTLLVSAIALGIAVRLLDRQLSARDLAIVSTDTPLRLAPALSADRAASLRIGEVARILERRGAWARVGADAQRDGWIDASLLLPLARD